MPAKLPLYFSGATTQNDTSMDSDLKPIGNPPLNYTHYAHGVILDAWIGGSAPPTKFFPKRDLGVVYQEDGPAASEKRCA